MMAHKRHTSILVVRVGEATHFLLDNKTTTSVTAITGYHGDYW